MAASAPPLTALVVMVCWGLLLVASWTLARRTGQGRWIRGLTLVPTGVLVVAFGTIIVHGRPSVFSTVLLGCAIGAPAVIVFVLAIKPGPVEAAHTVFR